MEFDQNLTDLFIFSEKISKDIDGTPEQREQVIDRVLALSLIHISEPTRPMNISYAVFCLFVNYVVYFYFLLR